LESPGVKSKKPAADYLTLHHLTRPAVNRAKVVVPFVGTAYNYSINATAVTPSVVLTGEDDV
jgi:hypothetical protein